MACSSPRALMQGKPDSHVMASLAPDNAKAARAATAYERNPKNPRAAFEYARSLRELGHAREAVMVLSDATHRHPNDKDLVAEYAKSLTAAGRADEAIAVFGAAKRLSPNDWSLLSAEGIALDQVGHHRQARKRYDAALQLRPEHPDVMTNLALSHALSGNLSAAEAILRRAARNPDAGSQVRQNLALVLALRGRFDEAENMMAHLDPATAQANLSAMREMFQQPALWAAAKRTAPISQVARSELVPERKTVGRAAPLAPAGQTAALVKPQSGAKKITERAAKSSIGTNDNLKPSKYRTGSPAVKPRGAKAGTKSQHKQAAPAAQSLAVDRPLPQADLGNGIDTTFFAFEYQ